jgi:hypothetical protein
MITYKNPRTYARIRKSPPGCPRVFMVFSDVSRCGEPPKCAALLRKKECTKKERDNCVPLLNQTKLNK